MKRKPKPITVKPSPWDHGATGPANRFGLIIEERGEQDATGRTVNPNAVTGVRRVDMLDFWHRHGTLSAAAYTVACDLRDAFENTQRSPGTSFEQDRVDSSPKPDHAVTIATDRISKYHAINRRIASADAPLIHHCVLHGGTPATWRDKGMYPYRGTSYLAGLRELAAALERLARERG